ncbi:MAG: hypothetical protein MK137_05475, partial [Rickettsiales bacterium]|nr:hypothetical protein [Rickettsiales bacterium]
MTTEAHAGVSRCWHETDQINACEGNRAGGGVALDQGCDQACRTVYSYIESGDGIVLPAVPTYLRPPAAGGTAETTLADLSTWHDNLGFTPNHTPSPRADHDANYPDGWHLKFRSNTSSPYLFDNITAFPSTYLLDDHGTLTALNPTPETLLSGAALSGSLLGSLSDDNTMGGFLNESIRGARRALGYSHTGPPGPDTSTVGSFQFPFTDVQYRNCVRACGSMLTPMAMDSSTDYYPPTHFIQFEEGSPPFTTDPAQPELGPTFGNYLPSSLNTAPIDPEFPIVERYESCWRECVVETSCDSFCEVEAPYDESNPRTFPECTTMCMEGLYFKYDNPGAQTGWETGDQDAFCLDQCETLVSSGGFDDCSSYWEPKLRARARVGAGGCSWINIKKTRSWTAQVEWDSLDGSKRNPSKEVTTPGNIFAARYYVAGIDGDSVGPGENPAICVYDMGASWWFQAADAIDSLPDRYREGGREKNRIPKANFPSGRDET